MKKLRSLLFPAAALALFVALTLRAGDAAEAARAGLTLSLKTAVPALFPFFVAGALLTKSGLAEALGRALARPVWALYGLDGNCAAALVLGLSGGYPVGAQAACDLYREKLISKRDAEALLGFCNNSGPAFILGVAGVAICGSARTGAALYLIHALAALITGLALTPAPKKGAPPPKPRRAAARVDAPAAFVSAVRESFTTFLVVTAFMTFFSIALTLLARTGALSAVGLALSPLTSFFRIPAEASDALVGGCVELTNGIAALPALALPQHVLLPLLSFLLGFGGLSVHCQTLSLTQAAGLSARRHTVGKLMHGVIAAALAGIWCCAAPRSLPVFAPAEAYAPALGLFVGLAVLLPVLLMLFLRSKKRT